jgi:hypothetical protein
MVILFYALLIMLALYIVYKIGFKYKIINPAVALTAIVMVLIVAPMPIKTMIVAVVLVYGVSSFVLGNGAKQNNIG